MHIELDEIYNADGTRSDTYEEKMDELDAMINEWANNPSWVEITSAMHVLDDETKTTLIAAMFRTFVNISNQVLNPEDILRQMLGAEFVEAEPEPEPERLSSSNWAAPKD